MSVTLTKVTGKHGITDAAAFVDYLVYPAIADESAQKKIEISDTIARHQIDNLITVVTEMQQNSGQSASLTELQNTVAVLANTINNLTHETFIVSDGTPL